MHAGIRSRCGRDSYLRSKGIGSGGWDAQQTESGHCESQEGSAYLMTGKVNGE